MAVSNRKPRSNSQYIKHGMIIGSLSTGHTLKATPRTLNKEWGPREKLMWFQNYIIANFSYINQQYVTACEVHSVVLQLMLALLYLRVHYAAPPSIDVDQQDHLSFIKIALMM